MPDRARTITRSTPEVRVLDADPDLARHLQSEDADEARRVLVARVAMLDTGPWDPALRGEVRGALGLLVLDGVLMRRASIREASSVELLGAGDLLRPWQRETDSGIVPCDATWEVLQPARVAILDRRFAAEMARWPELTSELLARLVRRSRWQGLSAAIGHVKRVEHRLLILMWHLAGRWGRVTPEGVVVPLDLTHERLAGLVGAQRPSVTTALSALVRRGLLLRRPDRTWLLPPEGQEELGRICGPNGSGASASPSTLAA
jgi:CRP/FNR family transcriptional regulator, cyclic AMP receptor protein